MRPWSLVPSAPGRRLVSRAASTHTPGGGHWGRAPRLSASDSSETWASKMGPTPFGGGRPSVNHRRRHVSATSSAVASETVRTRSAGCKGPAPLRPPPSERVPGRLRRSTWCPRDLSPWGQDLDVENPDTGCRNPEALTVASATPACRRRPPRADARCGLQPASRRLRRTDRTVSFPLTSGCRLR